MKDSIGTEERQRPPRVTVIVVNFNGDDYVLRAQCELERQTFSDFRVGVVDNVSTDGSAKCIEKQFRSVKLVRATSNHGVAGGNNLRLGEATGSEWITLLNPDAFA